MGRAGTKFTAYYHKVFRWVARTFRAKKDGKLMYSVQEFSNVSGLSEKEIYELIKKEEIKTFQFEEGGRYRIPEHEIERFLKKDRKNSTTT